MEDHGMHDIVKGLLILVLLGAAMLISTAILNKKEKKDDVADDAEALYKQPDIFGLDVLSKKTDDPSVGLPVSQKPRLIIVIAVAFVIVFILLGFFGF